MTTIAKFLIAAIGVAVMVAEEVARAHGWAGVDWTPIGTAAVAAVGVFLYPNSPTAPKPPTPLSP